MTFEEITENNYGKVAAVYLEGIATGTATFETRIPDWAGWDRSHLPFCRIALTDGVALFGWAALSPVSSRTVYSGVAEISIYITEKYRSQGLGKKLLTELISQSEKNGIWTLQAGIMKDNEASIRLHQNCGFRIIGYREKIGKLNGIWKDNIILERRSKITGIN